MMKIIVFLVSLVLLAVFGLFLYTWYRFHVITNFHSESLKRELPSGWKANTQSVTNSDGQKIAYWYFWRCLTGKSDRSRVILQKGTIASVAHRRVKRGAGMHD